MLARGSFGVRGGVPVTAVIPGRAADVVPGRSVIRTFEGDALVTDVYVTASGFHLLQFADRPIRAFYGTDVVYLVVPESGAR